MKDQYTELEAEVIYFESEDVIITSSGTESPRVKTQNYNLF